ncbi:hypothetical protein, conserved, partial [Babesia bigemina]
MRHVPKKLTDCPENLRESIDWLIQVRHGNGKNGDGLTKLSQALKKLIEEAIGKATKSLQAEKSKLECPVKYKGNESTCQFYQKKIEEINSQQPPESGKSKNGFTRQDLEEAKKRCESNHTYYRDGSKQKAYDEITERQKQLKELESKLTKFTEELNKDGNNNILTHLCDGLQTFLGFNSATKGYDGSGIVYSDLDRLCDGVMAFLSGVLGAVKNENEVETYDKHLNKRLNEVLKEVNNKIGSGRTGLAASVGAVKGWLEGYEGEVKKRTENVVDNIGKLIINLNSHSNVVNSKKVDNLEKQLESWNSTVSDIAREIEVIEEEKISKLDKALKIKINSEIKVVKTSVKLLKDSALNVALVRKVKDVDEALRNKEEEIKWKLMQAFSDVGKRVQSLETCKDQQIWLVKKTIEKADAFLDRSFYTEYIYKILASFNQIESEVKNVYKSLNANKGVLVTLVGEARSLSGAIKNGVKKGSDSRGDLSLQHQWSDFKEHVTTLVKELNGTDRGHPGPNINGLFHDIEYGIETYAKQFENTRNGETGFNGLVQKWLTELLQSVTITAALGDYVKDNKKANMETIFDNVEEGIMEIAKAIAGLLSTEIEAAIGAATAAAKSGENGIERYVNAISACCSTFAGRLEARITEDNPVASTGTKYALFRDIATAMDTSIKRTTKTPINKDKSQLSHTIELLLHKLVVAAKQTGTELLEFTGMANELDVDSDGKQRYDLGKNLNDAMDKVGGIWAQLKSGAGHQIDTALDLVIAKIGDLEKLLQNTNGQISLKIEDIQDNINRLEKLQNRREDGRNRESDVVIDRKGEEADRLMKELKIDLKHKLNEITVAVSNAGYALDTAIQSLLTTLNKSKDLCLQSVTSAFTTVTSEVRALFSDAHKADLAALKTLVDGQKAEIERIIEHDKHNGLKGLLIDKIKEETHSKLDDFIRIAATPIAHGAHQSQLFTEMSEKFQWYSKSILDYIRFQLRTPPKIPGQESEPSEVSIKVGSIRLSLDRLLDHLEKPKLYAYDHKFVDLLKDLNDLVTALHPSSFADSPSPLLAPLKTGLSAFTQQLGHAYVNRYSGKQFRGQLVETKQTNVMKDGRTTNESKEDLTPEGRNCAKVCLTIVEMVYDAFEELKKKCSNDWYGKQINAISSLGGYLKRNGYIVSTGSSKQDGELRNTGDMMGQHIIKNLIGAITGSEGNGHLQKCKDDDKNNSEEKVTQVASPAQVNVMAILKCLFRHIRQYNEVGHFVIHSKPKTPCSIYEMLVWFTGLTYNRAYQALQDDGFTGLLVKTKNHVVERDDDFEVEYVDKSSYYIEAYPQKITYEEIMKSINDMCTNSHELLTTILGT